MRFYLFSDLASIYEDSNDDDQMFIQNLGLYLSTFFSSHLKALEAAAQPTGLAGFGEVYIDGHFYLIKVSEVSDR